MVFFSLETLCRPNSKKRLSEFDWFCIFHYSLCDHALNLCLDFIHHFHRLDYANNGVRIYFRANLNIRSGFR